MRPELVENTRAEVVAALAVLALDELTPTQLARVEERLQLVLSGPLPVASWLASRFSRRRRRSVAA